jgi:hypothetical protein
MTMQADGQGAMADGTKPSLSNAHLKLSLVIVSRVPGKRSSK